MRRLGVFRIRNNHNHPCIYSRARMHCTCRQRLAAWLWIFITVACAETFRMRAGKRDSERVMIANTHNNHPSVLVFETEAEHDRNNASNCRNASISISIRNEKFLAAALSSSIIEFGSSADFPNHSKFRGVSAQIFRDAAGTSSRLLSEKSHCENSRKTTYGTAVGNETAGRFVAGRQ